MINCPAPTIKHQTQQGFTLIEVLVSAILLAIGLLGMGALQTTAMKYTYNADLRSKAILLAYDMADRMRTNMDFENFQFNSAYDGISTENNYTNKNCSKDDGTPSNAGCSVNDMVLNDAYRWTSDVSSKLPAGVGTVALKNGFGGPFYQITLKWQDTTAENGTSNYILNIKP